MRRIRNRYFLLSDALLLTVSTGLLYTVLFETWWWPAEHRRAALTFLAITVPLDVGILFLFGCYRRLWQHASIGEIELIVFASATVAIPNFLIGRFLIRLLEPTGAPVPLSVLVPGAALNVGLIAAPRLLARIAGWRSRRRRRADVIFRRTLVAGAGAAGEMIVRELMSNPDLQMVPVGFVDDDIAKRGLRLAGLPILGSLADIGRVARQNAVDEVVIAMPKAPGSVVREVVRKVQEAGVKARIVPGLYEILSDRVSVNSLREVQIEDLLRREPVQTDLAAVSKLAANKTVLVTGAGGSIGSELCRQLLALGPSRLVLLGHGENPIFDIVNELRPNAGDVELSPVIADIRDARRLRSVFETHRPFAVFHAAAHKHVPLMEANACEAVTNNVLGTKNVVDLAVELGTEHFVLISTDKAVRPTNIMGASKRVAELIVHDAGVRHRRNFVAVRFGNVLGSQGSVVPTFLRQIRAGGPVTVTHPEMRRYFMTIPEAVQLVLQAGSLGHGGDLFMLDMGEPVKVVDLARDMIRLSGLEEGSDIEIQFTSIRPGEKLFEEMLLDHETAEPTEHPKILRSRNGQEVPSENQLVDELIHAATHGASDLALRRLLERLVPDFGQGGDTSVADREASRDRAPIASTDPLFRKVTPAPG